MKKRVFLVVVLFVIAAFCILMRVGIDRNFGISLESELGNQCAYIINDAVQHALAENGNIADMLVVEKNAQGIISYMYVDSTVLNTFSLDVMAVLEDAVTGLGNMRLQVPIGNLIFSQMLSGKGPCIEVEAYPVAGIDVDFESSLKNAGINQVLFHMEMKTMIKMESVFGFRRFTADIEREVPVCDIIIVGNVPETYANLPAETDFLNLVP